MRVIQHSFRAAIVAVLVGNASAQDLIRQIQTVHGQTVIHDIPVHTSQGTILSEPVTDNTVFQLYTQVDPPPSGGLGLFLGATILDLGLELSLSLFGKDVSAKFVKVDEITVGTFMPQASIEVLSEDPHVPPRTRADQPYGIRVQVAGLQPADSSAPVYARQLELRRSYRVFDPLIYAPTSATPTGEYADVFSFPENGTFVDHAILQRLPTDLPAKISGEETFTLYTHPDAGPVQSQFASATVHIWPVATAILTGIESTRTYQNFPQNAAVQLADLYPKSITYVQVYPGDAKLGTSGVPLPGTVIAYDTAVPQNAVIGITGGDELLGDDGPYTVEVLTITPFNQGAPERLAFKTFNLKRNIRVDSNVVTMDDP